MYIYRIHDQQNCCFLFLFSLANSKAALKSKILAEFTVGVFFLCVTTVNYHWVWILLFIYLFWTVKRYFFFFFNPLQPQTLIEQLSTFKKAITEEELREKQLPPLRLDICSSEALKRLKGQIFIFVGVTSVTGSCAFVQLPLMSVNVCLQISQEC